MAFSIFSNQASSDQEGVVNDAEISKNVRTMKDDLLDIKNEKEKNTSITPNNLKMAPIEKPVQNIPLKQTVSPFVKDTEKFSRTQIDNIDQKSTSTVPEKVPIKNKNIIETVSQSKNTKSILSPVKAIPKEIFLANQPKERGNPLLIIGVVMIIISLISGGIYYYFFFMTKKVETPSLIQLEKNIPKEVTKVPQKESPFSLNEPNYLSINTEAVSPEEIQKTLSATAARIKESEISQPIEFLVTDQNNNPLTFSRFALILKIDLDPTTLAQIDEIFFLYIYNDAGSMRIGLDLTIKDQEIMLSALSKIENTLPSTFRMLLLEPNIIVPETKDFKSNTYASRLLPEQKNPLRYANIDIAKKVSIDYAIVNNHWYIGTSRNTLIVLLDRITK